jgi:poly-beta-1,6-N-acetyl-D-glucosamine synthase
MTELALGALLVLAYTYLGYPMLAALLARTGHAAPRGSTGVRGIQEPRLSVCVAVYNGAPYVDAKLKSLLALDYPADRIEFLFYSDGSTDDTVARIRSFAEQDPRVRLIECTERKGKPTALNALREAASGEILLMTDIRPPLHPSSARALVAALADPSVGCVSGNLVLIGAASAGAYWRYENFIRQNEARLGKMVGVTGPIYAIRKRDLPELPADVLLDDVWVPMQLALTGKRAVLAECAEAYDQAFEDEREFRRKVRTLAGNYQLFRRLPRLLLPIKNPIWFQVVSHKILRLVCPWALACLLAGSALTAFAAPGLSGAERSFWQTLFFGQFLFYALAALGPRAGRIAALARTFVVLNAAAVIGLWRFARGSQPVTW